MVSKHVGFKSILISTETSFASALSRIRSRPNTNSASPLLSLYLYRGHLSFLPLLIMRAPLGAWRFLPDRLGPANHNEAMWIDPKIIHYILSLTVLP
jgi:hypothetical protein